MTSNNRRFVALLSSGLDSPIAVYLMMKKGWDAVLLSYKVSNPENSQFNKKIERVAHHLHELTGRKLKVYIADHQKTLQEFIEKGNRKLTCILCKSYMLFSAFHLSKQVRADFVVNGDILGEQASQTLDNISVIQTIMPDIPIIRPLIGFEKKDILKLSHQLGFYELSTLPDEQCSYNPMYPETHASIKEVKDCLLRTDFSTFTFTNLENAQVLIVE